MIDDERELDNNPQEDFAEILESLGSSLAKTAQEQISIRQTIETRWLDDLDQYMGRYDADTLTRLKAAGGSQTFVNITRPKSLAAESRLADMLFPSDDKNWAIQPTPIPDVQNFSAQTLELLRKEATKRSEAMAAEIDDQLIEANYHRKAREMIHDACLFGTGILKGVVITEKVSQKWQAVNGAVHELLEQSTFVPNVEKVDIWNFFPDMAAHILEDCEFILERRYVSRSQLRKLAKRPGYLKENIKKILHETQPQKYSAGGTHVSRLREASGLNANLTDNRFELWEYHGTLPAKDLMACGCDLEDNELAEHSAVIVFINGVVIKGDINPNETGELPYSMLLYEKDDSSIFGVGVPFLLRNEQRIANAAWRMALDNAALTTKPQIIFNRELVTPADGVYSLSSGKVWYLNSEVASVRDVFATHEINGHQSELINLFELVKKMADDVTSLPLIAQGSQNAAPDTASGTAMLMNAANTQLRRIVKYFDDYVTEPMITRFYNWNMQNSDKAEIKGDMTIDARGSSALLVKEQQNQSLRSLLLTAEQPSYAPLTKHAELYRKAIQAEHLNADDIVKTDDEIAADVQQPDPIQQQIQQLTLEKLQAEISKIKSDVTRGNVDGIYSAINAAKEVAVLPAIAPMADEVYKSAGGEDFNQFPLINNPQAVAGVPPQDNLNTHPQYPPNPDVGMMRGIDS